MLNFSKVTFPVFEIPDSWGLQVEDKATFVEDVEGRKKFLDDKSYPASSLSMRRLQLEAAGRKLMRLRRGVYDIPGLLHLKSKRFIDSTGLVFNYVKTTRVPKECYPLKFFMQTAAGYVLFVKGLHCRFFSVRAPELEEKFVQVLRVGKGFIFYDLVCEQKKTTWAKI